MSNATGQVCNVCSASPCYGICPNADPFYGNAAAEHDDHEFNSRFDDHRERYAAEAASMGREWMHDREQMDSEAASVPATEAECTRVLLAVDYSDDIPF